MSGTTISFHVGSNGVGSSLAHNNRENVHGNPDIDTSRTQDNICYVKRDIQELYHEVFDDAVADYNAKQKRSDRKIDDYYKKILHDKKTEHQRELIVAIGKGDDKEISFELKKDVLDCYIQEFQERNPNLKVYNAVMHLDESNPHLHINYVPVYESSRGLAKRVGHNKAIEQQGFESFEDWRANETKIIEQELKELGVERQFKGSHAYMRVGEYKTYAKELERLKEAKNEVKNNLQKKIGEFFETEQEVKKKKHKVIDLENKAKVLEKGIVQELEFDNKLKEYGYLYQSELKDSDVKKIPMVGEVVKVEKYRELEKKYEIAVYQNEKLKMSNEFNPTYQNSLRDDLEKKYNSLQESYNMKNKLNDSLTERVNKLTKENRALGTENKALRTENEKLTKNLEFFKSELKETLNSIMELRKTMKQFFKENNLTIEFRDRLREVKFRWNSAVRRAIDFHENKDKDIRIQPIEKAIQTQSKSKNRGMER